MRAPWLKASVGKHTTSITTLVDLYRTLGDLLKDPLNSIRNPCTLLFILQ